MSFRVKFSFLRAYLFWPPSAAFALGRNSQADEWPTVWRARCSGSRAEQGRTSLGPALAGLHSLVQSKSSVAEGAAMARHVTIALYIMAMVAVIVGVDIAFFRNRFWERLMANVGIVMVFAAFYFRFFRGP
jgi:hypothetical protein